MKIIIRFTLLIKIETFRYQVILLYIMLDPDEIEHLIVDVFDEEQVFADITFNGINIEPDRDLTKFIYSFTVLYGSTKDRVKINHHIEKIQNRMSSIKSVEQPCEIVLDLMVG